MFACCGCKVQYVFHQGRVELNGIDLCLEFDDGFRINDWLE